MRRYEYIPVRTYTELMDRFTKFLKELDGIYKDSRLHYLEKEAVVVIITGIVNSYLEGKIINKSFARQMVTYELYKYFHPELPMKDIGELAGYKKGSCRPSAHNNVKVVQNYIDTKDERYYHEILELDSKIENVLL